jgi:hypothetical protein
LYQSKEWQKPHAETEKDPRFNKTEINRFRPNSGGVFLTQGRLII